MTSALEAEVNHAPEIAVRKLMYCCNSTWSDMVSQGLAKSYAPCYNGDMDETEKNLEKGTPVESVNVAKHTFMVITTESGTPRVWGWPDRDPVIEVGKGIRLRYQIRDDRDRDADITYEYAETDNCQFGTTSQVLEIFDVGDGSFRFRTNNGSTYFYKPSSADKVRHINPDTKIAGSPHTADVPQGETHTRWQRLKRLFGG